MFESLKKLFQEAGGEIQQIRRNLETARQQRDVTASAPLAREDVVAAMHQAMDLRAAAHHNTLAKALTAAVYKGEPGRVDVRAIALAKPDYAATPAVVEDAAARHGRRAVIRPLYRGYAWSAAIF